MTQESDSRATPQPATDPQWYKKIWTLDIQDMAWVEETQA